MKTNNYTIVKKAFMVLSFCLFTFLPFPLSAQTFTQRIQNKGTATGTIVIHQSDSIDQLVNSAKLGATSTGTSSQTTNTTNAASGSNATSTANASNTATTGRQQQDGTLTNTDNYQEEATEQYATTKKMMRGYKVNGYRVQAFAGGNSRKDRQQAERIGNEIKAQFNNVPVYVHFYSPRWICRVGNFRTYEEAHQMLIGLRKMGFSQATIVKGKITVPY
jgi:cytoskeletal protein RodZ